MLSVEGMDFLVNRIKQEEGYKRFPYDDMTGMEVKAPKGNLTIGYGLNLTSRGLKPYEAELIARNIIKENYLDIAQKHPFFETLNEPRQCVLLDMAYNMGEEGLEQFKNTLNFVSTGFYKNAATQMRKSEWYKKLTSRAEPLCAIMESGKFI